MTGNIQLEQDGSVWCTIKNDELLVILNSSDISLIRETIEPLFRKRNEEFDNLMKIDKDGNININFISYFGDYFGKNLDCLCNDLVDTGKQTDIKMLFYMGKIFGKGAKGIASQLCVRGGGCPFIMKGMKGVTFKSYISLRINSINKNLKPSISTDSYNTWKFQDGSYNIISVGTSGFKTQTSIHMALNNILGNNPNYVYQYDAFFCGGKSNKNTGYNITELADYGDLSNYLNNHKLVKQENITDEFLIDILRQVFEPLFLLKQDKYLFNHSDLKTRNVFVAKGIDGKPVYKLADFDKSSIFWNGIRFYNSTWNFNKYLNKIKGIVTETKKYYTFNFVKSLDLSSRYMQIYNMHNPYPTFQSYDFYTFFYSLLLEPRVYMFVLENPNSDFIKVWSSMWTKGQISKVMEDLKESYINLPLKKKERLSFIKKEFVRNKYHLLKDITFLIDMLGLNVPEESKSGTKPTLIKSRDGHLCISKCDVKCKTNKYSKIKKTNTFETDWCKSRCWNPVSYLNKNENF